MDGEPVSSLLAEALDARYLIVVALYDSGILSYPEYVEVRNKLSDVTKTLHEHLFAQATYLLPRLDASNKRHAEAIVALSQVVQTSGKLLMAYEPKNEENDGDGEREKDNNTGKLDH